MKKQICLALFAYAALGCTLSSRLAAQNVNAEGTPASFIVFDAGYPVGIDAQGTVVGNSSVNCNFFYRLADGTISEFAEPGVRCTQAFGINAGGTIVGTYSDGVTTGGFTRDPKGNFTKFSVPNSQSTQALAINSSGAIAGDYTDSSNAVHGFLRDTQGNLTSFDLPGFYGFFTSSPRFSINAGGDIVGNYYGSVDNNVGFLRESNGNFTMLQPPNAAGVFANGIDDAGRVFGYYYDGFFLYYGFLRDQSGNYTLINFSSTSSNFYAPIASDQNGTLVGSVMNDSSSECCGGFYLLKDGKTGFFDPPTSAWTIPTAVNPQGEITGYFYESDLLTSHAFIRLAQ